MKRLAGLLFTAALALAQNEQGAGHANPAAKHAGAEAAEHGTQEHGDPNQIWWKWANFALLAGGLGYVVAKNAGPFFLGRTSQIRKGIEDAETAQTAAGARMRQIEARLENLGGEIAGLKDAAAREQATAAGRARSQTAAALAKIQTHAAREIASAGKAARMELKSYTAELAVQLAESKLRARMTPEAQDRLVRGFARRLPERPS